MLSISHLDSWRTREPIERGSVRHTPHPVQNILQILGEADTTPGINSLTSLDFLRSVHNIEALTTSSRSSILFWTICPCRESEKSRKGSKTAGCRVPRPCLSLKRLSLSCATTQRNLPPRSSILRGILFLGLSSRSSGVKAEAN